MTGRSVRNRQWRPISAGEYFHQSSCANRRQCVDWRIRHRGERDENRSGSRPRSPDAGAPFFIPGVLANPSLRLFSGQSLIAQNDNWQGSPSCAAVVCGGAELIAATGSDPCRPNPGQASAPENCSLESAILITVNPGAYTVQLSGVNGGAGVGLIEVFQTQN
jgi:hypothetical protein